MSTTPHKGRGAVSRRAGRFETRPVIPGPQESARLSAIAPETVVCALRAGKIVSHNASPDVPFERSINPYQGCEHGCVYCYARPSHSYLDLSPGLDFETRIFYKQNAASRLLEEWERPGYRCRPITIGANTDPYQPAERSLRITRELLELFRRYRHPVTLITKSKLILRDTDILGELAAERLCSVAISLATMDAGLKRLMEPRVPSARARLEAVRGLSDAGVPVSVLVAPVIPAINDHEIERILEAVSAAGALRAHYILLRLPHEVKSLFEEWLHVHFPARSKRVMSLVRAAHGGRDYDSRFGRRQTGTGAYAEMIAKRFEAASRRFRLGNERSREALDTGRFSPPGPPQIDLDLGYS